MTPGKLDDHIAQQTGTRHVHGGRHVSHFTFGEYYTVHLDDGHGYAVPDLELILAILIETFETSPGLVPRLRLQTRQPGIGRADQRELVVRAEPFKRDSFLPAPSLTAVVRHVREQVTYYNLSGTWDRFLRSNL